MDGMNVKSAEKTHPMIGKETLKMKKGSYILDLIVVGAFAALTAIVTKRVDDKNFDEKLDEALAERGITVNEEEAK